MWPGHTMAIKPPTDLQGRERWMNGSLITDRHRLCDVTWGKGTVVWIELGRQLAPRMHATGGEPRVAWFNWCMKCMKPMKDLQATGPVHESLEYQDKQRRCVCLYACVYMRERKRDTTLYPMLILPLSSLLSIYCGLVARSCLTLATPWTVARQAPLSIGFPRQEYWSGSPWCVCKDKHICLW